MVPSINIKLSYVLLVLNSLYYFWFQPMVHNWSTKGCGMCCPVCEKVHAKDPLLLIVKGSLSGNSGFPLKIYVTMTICLMSNSQ